jgi:hypothetical protein
MRLPGMQPRETRDKARERDILSFGHSFGYPKIVCAAALRRFAQGPRRETKGMKGLVGVPGSPEAQMTKGALEAGRVMHDGASLPCSYTAPVGTERSYVAA